MQPSGRISHTNLIACMRESFQHCNCLKFLYTSIYQNKHVHVYTYYKYILYCQFLCFVQLVLDEIERILLKKKYEEEIANGTRKLYKGEESAYPFVANENQGLRDYVLQRKHVSYGKTLLLQSVDNQESTIKQVVSILVTKISYLKCPVSNIIPTQDTQ